MRVGLMALYYATPDQIMGLASGIASILGVLLMFWNKLLVAFGKVANWFRPAAEPQGPPKNGS